MGGEGGQPRRKGEGRPSGGKERGAAQEGANGGKGHH
jgi:hypothetical protein